MTVQPFIRNLPPSSVVLATGEPVGTACQSGRSSGPTALGDRSPAAAALNSVRPPPPYHPLAIAKRALLNEPADTIYPAD